jgi:hypothetical protein
VQQLQLIIYKFNTTTMKTTVNKTFEIIINDYYNGNLRSNKTINNFSAKELSQFTSYLFFYHDHLKVVKTLNNSYKIIN